MRKLLALALLALTLAGGITLGASLLWEPAHADCQNGGC